MCVHEFVIDRRRLRQDPEPAERVHPLVLAQRAGGEHRSADTVVAVDDDILGKPADADQARKMLERLSGRAHRVFSAVAMVSPGLPCSALITPAHGAGTSMEVQTAQSEDLASHGYIVVSVSANGVAVYDNEVGDGGAGDS